LYHSARAKGKQQLRLALYLREAARKTYAGSPR
jgi:hypothetical protein